MKKLFAQEVPEIYDGIIEIKAAARDPGSRAKIGVISHDSSIDPVGACVGMKGSRVQAVVQEMQGEKIDIIPWSPDLATFVVNALQPATVSRVVIDEERVRIEVVVPDDQLSLAIGRRGQNVRLASQLTASAIDIMTEADASEKRQKEFVERSTLFQEELDVDETLAQLLVAEGFGELEEVAYVEADESPRSKALTTNWPPSCRAAPPKRWSGARKRRARNAGRWASSDALAEMPYLNEAMLVTLGKAGIKTLDDLADSPPTNWCRRSGPSSAVSARATVRRTRAGSSPNMASPTSRATRSSWPPAPLVRRRGRRHGRRRGAMGRTRLRTLPMSA
jgi:N utilization substance protein A